MPKRWTTHKEEPIAHYRIFSISSAERSVLRKDGTLLQGDFYIIHSPNWVNVIPLTPDNKVVLVRQYRHGVDEISLEIPGGICNEGENPLDAARRECLEETGYSSKEEPELLGTTDTNPALFTNQCYVYLWRNCTFNTVQELDEHEDIEVIKIPLLEIPERIKRGEIRHTLVLTAFLQYFLRYPLPVI